MRRWIRPLDRYVFSEFWKIFVTTALGFPILVVVIDLTDNLDKYLDRNLPREQIFLSYLYWIPDTMFLVLPAAVLFATVFSVGAFTRHAEITAAKASGISFYRFIAPLALGALLATGLGLVLGELTPVTNARREELLEEKRARGANERYNFAYAADRGRVYQIAGLNVSAGALEGVQVERRGVGPDYPTYVITAERARFDSLSHDWTLTQGHVHLIPGPNADITVRFDSLRDLRFREAPIDLTAKAREPQELGYEELGRYIEALERSGGDANTLRVERMLKIAIPVTSLIILLFGAPLATSTQRGGAAYGIGVSLGTTVVFLMLIQLTKAVGAKGLIVPELAAWIPSILFGVLGLVLLARVRT